MLKQHSIGILAVIIASVLWGTTGVAATFAPDVSAVAIGAAAMGIGGILQAILAIRVIRQNWAKLYAHRALFLLGGITIAVYPLAFYASMRLSGVTIGTVVSIGSAPVIAAVIESVFDGQPITKHWLIGACLGLAGIFMLCVMGSNGGGASAEHEAFNTFIGVALGLIAGFTYALYSWVARSLMMCNLPSLAVMGALFGFGGALLLPLLMITGGALLQSWTNFSVGAYMALVPMFLGYVLFGYGLSRVQASTATAISLIEPVVAALLAIVIVGERLGVYGWFGVALILFSLFYITKRENKAV